MTSINDHIGYRVHWWHWECSCGKVFRFFQPGSRWRWHVFETVEQYL